jgi:nucleoside-diphosphate-sugar epimerase
LDPGSADGRPGRPRAAPHVAEVSQGGANRWRIIGTARGAESLEAIRALGYEGLPFTGNTPSVELARAIGEATHLLISAAPDEAGDPLLAQHRADLEAAPNLQWIGYLSTIGVYGDHQGAWVDESTEPRPVSDRSRWRLDAEQAWEAFAAARGLPLQIFRLAGIYGPGRNPLERIKAGRERTIVKPGQVFNRIHVADIATTVIAGIETGNRATGVFNVTDDEPAPPQDVAAFAAELLGTEPPPLVAWEEAEKSMTPMARSFYMETKRMRNSRIKDSLGVELAYPTYREGLGDLARGLLG